ncbi:hypothetical protein, partial [Paratractidigestivibacter sp.]|uniref:hypothetical protein n=1 Tax=Paratractidigestivibacter sp. TaxID=2847316 RepID=UPI002ACB14E6
MTRGMARELLLAEEKVRWWVSLLYAKLISVATRRLGVETGSLRPDASLLGQKSQLNRFKQGDI